MPIRAWFLPLLAFLLYSSTALGQTAALHCPKLLDVRSGTYVNDAIIVIADGKISELGTSTSVRVPGNAQTIEVPGTCLPGLIDVHTHLTDDPESGFGYAELGISVPREAIYGAKNARKTLLAGFTTVRNVGASGYTDVAVRDGINAGDIPGPRMLVSGPPLSITGGHCDNNLLPFEYHKTPMESLTGPGRCARKCAKPSSTALI